MVGSTIWFSVASLTVIYKGQERRTRPQILNRGHPRLHNGFERGTYIGGMGVMVQRMAGGGKGGGPGGIEGDTASVLST